MSSIPDSATTSRLSDLDFVFLIRLRYVNKVSSLPEIIIAQHDKLEPENTEVIRAIVKGKTKHKVLLLMDGYDEYQPGTNKEIDKAIDATVGNCLLVLTSRPGYLKKQIRNKMDGEIMIEGFSQHNMVKCSELFLGTKEKREAMIQQVKNSGIEDLLKVPIILLMVCTLFLEKKKLPENKTEIVGTIFKLAMDRGTLKSFGLRSSEAEIFEESLMTLGELSWQALQKDVQQLLLNKVRETDLFV